MESIDSPQNPTPRLKVVPPNQIKPPTSSPAAQKLPIPAQLPTQPETTLPIPNGGGGSGGSGGSQTIKGNTKKIPHTLIMVGTIAAVLIGIGLIPWEYNINGNGKVEPDSNEEKLIGLSSGNFLEELRTKDGRDQNKFLKGETIAITTDLQQQDKLSEIKQNIADAISQKKMSEQDLDIAIKQLQQAEVTFQLSKNRGEEARINVNNSPTVAVSEQEIQIRYQEQENWQRELQEQENQLIIWEGLIQDKLLGSMDERVRNTNKEISRLKSLINLSRAQINQAEARRGVVIQGLDEEYKKEVDRSLEESVAVSTALARVDQARQKISENQERIQQLQKREQELEKEQERQRNHVAPFDGVADFTDAKKYRNQRLTEQVKIRFYNPDNMLVRIKVTQLDYCRINEGMEVSFIPYGKKEMMGKVELKATGAETEQGNPNAVLYSVWVRVNSTDGDQKITLDNDMMGKTSIKVGSERIYKIVGGEIYKLFNPLQSSFSYCE